MEELPWLRSPRRLDQVLPVQVGLAQVSDSPEPVLRTTQRDLEKSYLTNSSDEN